MTTREYKSILVPGENCWRVEKADKASFLIDGEAYFQAFREAVKLARKTVFISGWDIDSRLALLRQDPDDGYPVKLREFLNAIAGSGNQPKIYILIWDFAMLVGLDREWFPIYRLDWKTHDNIHVAMDDLHPVGASQHQKIVVIDDSLAFVGGLDLTKNRWDTPQHAPQDKRRKSPGGEFYRPHHDVQIMLAGPPAADLGDFFRQRWEIVSSRPIPAQQSDSQAAVWPDSITTDIENCTIGIARTRARYDELTEIREVENLYLDSIKQARSYIYIENQYLTAQMISQALAESLRNEDGPEIIIILPLTTDGWLSQITMDVMRKRAVHEMRQADTYNRLGVFYAYQKGLSEKNSIKIHAKMMIVDDAFVRIGSSNLNNRSMGLDTECDIALETNDVSDNKKAVARFCNKLLAEHLGVTADVVAKSVNETGSRLQTIYKLQGKSRTLKELHSKLDEAVELVTEEQYLLDPERPIEPEQFLGQLMGPDKFDGHGFNKIGLIVLLLVFICLALAWHYTPLHDMISGDHLLRLVSFLKSSKIGWLYVFGAYICSAILMIPILFLITVTILIYGSIEGFIIAILGSCLSGTITYWFGRILGRRTVRKIGGDKVNRVSKRLGKNGFVSTFIIRLIPLAPYSIVNIIAGATHIRFRDFILGTFLGLMPGTLAIAGLIDRGLALISEPGLMTVLGLMAVAASIAVGYFFIRKKLQREN
jgi:phosphatidylserine/phosphatidylglycerophosphate/cardiolipin synthase-like enzyme/uncharacterized membrane protein YdjX (TVP38/TMEM64 family)